MQNNFYLAIALATLITGCGGNSSDSPNGTGGSSKGGASSGGNAGASSGGNAGASSGGAAGANGKDVGDPCTAPDQCPAGGSGTPVCLTDWPGGYCAVSACEQHGHDCPNDPGLGGTATTGSKCVLNPDATCLALCATKTDCRDGYDCAPLSDSAGHGSVDVCVPGQNSGGGGMSSGGGGMSSGGGGMSSGGGGMSSGGGGMGAGGGMMDGGM